MKKRIFYMGALLTALVGFGQYGASISLDHPSGVYKSGETATCRIELTKDGQPLEGENARMILKFESKVIETKDFRTTGSAMAFPYTAEKPGWVFFGFEVLDKDGKALKGPGVQRHSAKSTIVAEIGALFEPENIRTGVKRPEDFEAFWAARRAALDKVPIQPTLTPFECQEPGVELFKVSVPAIGEYPVTGYLALPTNAKPGSLPAYVDWASWSACDASPGVAVNTAKQGGIGFAPTWHGRSVGMGAEWYNYKTTIKIDGGLLGIEDREKWCFSDMYYRTMRALDFVKSLPEWDRRTLVSRGGSLGGAQSAAAAALDKDVTLTVVMNPCFCEFDGWASGRKSSIPHIHITERILAGDRGPLEAGAYFDCVNFAPMIKCRTFVCTGGTDELCPPSNVYAFYNALPAETQKQIFFNPGVGHYGQINRSVAPHLKKLFDSIRITPHEN